MKGIEAMEAFYHRIGMPVNMKELGINPTEEQMLQMVEGALKARGGSLGSAKVLGDLPHGQGLMHPVHY